MTDYLVYDVFTADAFGGNPLAIIPDATALPEASLQRIAREFNFSETTFVFPPDNGGDARVRIFTPTSEVPFAGHPTVGTSLALHDLGRVGNRLTLELGVGSIPVSITGRRARFTTRVPLQTWPGPPVSVVAESIGAAPEAISLQNHAPVIASVGLPFALAEVADRETLAKASPVTEAFRAFDPHWPTGLHYDLLIYVRSDTNTHVRMFAPLDGIPEDAATGSAAAALAAYLGSLERRSLSLDITQGEDMGRPSRIQAEVAVEDGNPVEVSVSGEAVRVMEGRLTL